MRRGPAATLLLLSALVLPAASFGQEDVAPARKILNQVTPQYPQIARNMKLRGSVRAEAVVEPNGIVKTVEVKGGHPLLVRAAQSAIYKWRWAPAAHETREPIEVKFNPE
jgi:TonB family protein